MKNKKTTTRKTPQKKSSVKKIYKTTDGFFTGRSDIDKPRRVAAVAQRKDDGALAVVKVYSKKDRSGKAYIKKLVLVPKKHSSLTEDSIVGSKVIVGIKEKTESGNQFKPIFRGDLNDTGDRLTFMEYLKIKFGLKNKDSIKKWRKHFRK